MSHRGTLSAILTTVLGATFGGLLMWRVYRTKRKRLPSIQTAADPVEACLPPPTTTTTTTTTITPLPLPAEDELDDVVDPPDIELQPVEKEFKSAESQIPQSPRSIHIPPAELLEVDPLVVTCEEEWQQLWPQIQEELSVFPALGLDCEWVSAKGRASAVSLLQIATYSGLCVLVRPLSFRSSNQPFPLTLVEVLRDPRVLKVGIGCFEDGKRLTRDYGLKVTCTLDLRYLAMRQRLTPLSSGQSLKALASDLLNVSLNKSLKLRCSNWEADELTLEQKMYAARDAQVSIALFIHLLSLQAEGDSALSSWVSYSKLASHCQGLLDVPFKIRLNGEERDRRRKTRKVASSDSPESGDQQVPDPRKPRKKSAGHPPRQSPLYDNCFLYAPDNQPLCTCDKKKANWYLQKGIGELQSEDPFVVRLLFEPSARPDPGQGYYLTARENLCVVCGKEDSYIRKNVVPHEYRRYFPVELKSHNCHDILLLCTSCHATCNMHDGFLKQQLAQEFSAPLGSEEGARVLEVPERRKARSAARALLYAKDELPQRRRAELQAIIKSYFNVSKLTEQTVKEAANLETKIFNQAFVPHGRLVVQGHAKQGLRGLLSLERRWRQHFLDAMRPKHLPHLWSIDYNHNKLIKTLGEDMPIQLSE